MATLTAINRKTQNAKALRNVIEYVEQEKKTRWGDAQLVTGYNCVPQSVITEMRMTKQQFRKVDGTQFYHFVQSFSADDDVTPQEVNAIGLEFAQRQFPDFEVVVATHVDTGHLHNHLVVNSVSCRDGHKLHQSRSDLIQHRKVNDEICLAHGLSVLEPPEEQVKKKRMKPGEYQAGLRGDSWKLDLIQAINEALEYSITREGFIANMEMEGYEVRWEPNRKHITFVCPNGRKCRDSSLHDETFLKENLEALFAYRQATASGPPHSSRTRAGWANWPQDGSVCWPTWSATQTGSSPHRPFGQTANNAAAKQSKSWPWARSSAAITAGSRPCKKLIDLRGQVRYIVVAAPASRTGGSK